MIFVVLAVFGLIFGSFVTAIVWRVREQEIGHRAKHSDKNNLSITSGRSQCPHCRHKLAAKDLVPVFSWLYLRGRCRYCRQRISPAYPITELAMAVIFVSLFAYWPGGVYGTSQWVLLLSAMGASIGLLALLVYDLKWMILPNRIIYPTLFVAAAGRLFYIAAFEPRVLHALAAWLASLLVASGIFWLIFTVSKGQWIGYGDVRLGLITGTLLASPGKSLLMIFIASLLGAIAALPSMVSGQRNLTSKLAFGPFLIVATWLSLLFGDALIDRYLNLVS